LQAIKKAEYATKSLFFVCGLAFSSWASRIPEIKEKLNLNDAEFGTVLFAMPIGSLMALPLAGFAVDKFGSRRIVILATCFYLIAMPFLGSANMGWQLAIALFLFGFGGDLLNISMNVQAVGVEKAQNRSFMNFFHAVFSVGFMVGAALGGYLAKLKIEPLSHLATVAIIVAATGFISYSLLLKTDEKPTEPQPLFAWPDKSLMVLGIICFCAMLAEGAMADWSVIYYKKALNQPDGFVTAGFTAFSVLMVLGRFLGDGALEKLGLSKLLLINSILLVLGIAIALGLNYPLAIIIGFGITGLGLSTIVPLIYSEAGHSKTMSSGLALAAITTVGMFGFLLGPVIIGYLSEATNLRIALSLLIVLGIISAFFTKKIQ
jgi:MFS family permease